MITTRCFVCLNQEHEIKNFINTHGIEKINDYCIKNSFFPFDIIKSKAAVIKLWLLSDLNIECIKDKNRDSFIFKAEKTIYLEWVKQLSKLNINTLNSHNQNALFNANENKMRWLLNEGIDVNCIDKNGKNALFFIKNLKEYNILVKKGININVIDFEGKTIFDREKLNENIIRSLLLNSNLQLETIEKSSVVWNKQELEMIELIKIRDILRNKEDLDNILDIFNNKKILKRI